MLVIKNKPAIIAPTNHPITLHRLVNFYLFYLNKAVHFNYFLIFLAYFLSFSILIWIAAATNARSFRSSYRHSCGYLYFPPRTRVGCDDAEFSAQACDDISIHAPAWGATLVPSIISSRFAHFNPRTRMGCDRRYNAFQDDVQGFQSTHPHGVRRSRRAAHAHRLRHFNPRTRMGCDFMLLFSFPIAPISIHAPVWGATLSFKSSFPSSHISIHAPAWGATVNAHSPRSPSRISIHAPAWGATNTGATAKALTLDFNPRTRMGCDKLAHHKTYLTKVFQSTHPHGVRHAGGGACHMGLLISIHAPAWGATFQRLRSASTFPGFQSTHPHGVRLIKICFISSSPKISIHAPAWGATVWWINTTRPIIFQSTHPHGVRLMDAAGSSMDINFNPRTRMGCDET